MIVSDNDQVEARQQMIRFKTYFSGLIFSTFAFASIHPFIKINLLLKTFKSLALFFFLIAGVTVLAQLSGAAILPTHPEKLSPFKIKLINFINVYFFTKSTFYWLFYLFGLLFILIDKVSVIFLH